MIVIICCTCSVYTYTPEYSRAPLFLTTLECVLISGILCFVYFFIAGTMHGILIKGCPYRQCFPQHTYRYAGPASLSYGFHFDMGIGEYKSFDVCHRPHPNFSLHHALSFAWGEC